MKRLLLDTNIILDIALKREPHFELSSKIFELIDKNRIIGYITASTVTDIYYISRKEKGNEIAIEFISNLIEIVDVIGVDKSIIVKALKSNLKDFEDAVQVSAAEYNEIEIIVTRNKSDFLNSGLEILTPKELVDNQN
ncbi:PIN domain-containing protein [Perlabentimonas gracilis]|uniref:PIN domain-containing protein n=1 Tax=Perlabentimonas gracilis TaxID=2715279 RepID=UPI001407C234|nr:PIN domain-containing protein [Perlabentimonas gracilis]NHB70230.1 PIN domain-containing protein [Perlabentimonas gracilis]